nr:uncharacterized protein LOC128690428 [Cherax quadricarinatus]
MVFVRVTSTQRALTSIIFCLLHAAAATPTPNSTHSGTLEGVDDSIPSLHATSASIDRYESELPRDWLQSERICSPFDLMEDHFRHYASIPLLLLTLSRKDSCEELERERQVVELDSHHNLFPEWLVDATVAGECPWELVIRDFIPGTVPPSIIEVVCLCDGHHCSRGGDFQCTPVTRNVKIWTSEPLYLGVFRPRIVTVTTACVCAQRQIPRGGEAELGLVH